MEYFWNCLDLGVLEALWCCRSESNYQSFHNLQHGQMNDEKNYIQQMSNFAIDGGLWGR
jgi:hypothetical protein